MAIKSLMGAVKLVVGLGVVIKTPQFPAIGVMAQPAVFTEPLLMCVIGLVA